MVTTGNIAFLKACFHNTFILLTPLALTNANDELEAIINIDKPLIYSLKPLNEIKISKNGNVIWSKTASSKSKITGPLNWPIKEINKELK